MMSESMEVDDQTQKRCTEAGEGNETKKQQREDDVLKNRNAVVDFDPSPVHSMQIKPMSIGEVNRVPLAMCKTGSRVWSRRRDPPFSLEYADITPEGELQAWTPVVTDEEGAEVYELGEYGMTRCGANMGYIALQRHQDGEIILTDGSYHQRFHLVLDPEADSDEMVRFQERAPLRGQNAVCTAIAVVGRGFAVACVIEDVGLVVVVLAPLAGHPAVRQAILRRDSSTVESTIGVDQNMVAVADGPNIYVYNAIDPTQGEAFLSIPVPGVDVSVEERIWQIAIAKDIITCCTTETVKWLHTKTKSWKSTPMGSVVAAAPIASENQVAILTALGDVIVLDARCRASPLRLEKGSEIVPFVSQHTRDSIFAWATKNFNACIRMVKPGGSVLEVSFS